MKLFTWNLNNNVAMAQLAIEYLDDVASRDDVIAAFQEWPRGYRASAKNLEFDAKLARQRSKHGGQLSAFSGVTMNDPAPFHATSLFNRATLVRYETTLGKAPLNVVNLHWHSRDITSGDDFVRGAKAALFRQALDRLVPPSEPLVIMGDFNIDPIKHSTEFGSPWCFFANHTRIDGPKTSKVTGANVDAWTYFGSDPRGAHRTHLWNNFWYEYDHIIISKDLQSLVSNRHIVTSISSSNGTTDLLKKQSAGAFPEPASNTSDHLPVECDLNIQ